LKEIEKLILYKRFIFDLVNDNKFYEIEVDTFNIELYNNNKIAYYKKLVKDTISYYFYFNDKDDYQLNYY
jgi:hypothetical protein